MKYCRKCQSDRIVGGSCLSCGSRDIGEWLSDPLEPYEILLDSRDRVVAVTQLRFDFDALAEVQ